MRALLDTHALIWALSRPARLGKGARRVIESGHNEVFASAASAWEIGIKAGLGKISFPLDDLPAALAATGITELPVTARHAIAVKDLPPLHRDPFDRMLVAQARVEELVLISEDEALAAYRVATLWS